MNCWAEIERLCRLWGRRAYDESLKEGVSQERVESANEWTRAYHDQAAMRARANAREALLLFRMASILKRKGEEAALFGEEPTKPEIHVGALPTEVLPEE